MKAHLSALTQTIAAYLVLAVAYFGWGTAAIHVFGLSNKVERQRTTLIWLGWACTLFLFQILHFFLPITAYVTIPVLVIGVAFSIPEILIVSRRWSRKRSSLVGLGVVFLVFLALTIWIASRSMLAPSNYDSGLYHFSAIRWINSYPIVPGLGNLHGRLAFNQSFFIYVAALNIYPFFAHGHAVANSFLLLLTIATCLDFLRPVFGYPSLLIRAHPFQYLSALFALPVLGYLSLFSSDLSSPSPDLACTLLQLVMFLMLARGITQWLEGQTDQQYQAILLVVLAATGVTIKLSNLAFSAAMVGFALLYACRASTSRSRGIVQLIAPVSAIMAIWCLRGVVLSGAPLYPSTFGYIPLKWAVPKLQIIDEANWIYSWARQPNVHWSTVLGSWKWLKPWILTIIDHGKSDVLYPVAVSIFICILTPTCIILKKAKPLHWLEWAILFPPLLALVYWFFSAPDPRFANALFFLASGASILLFVRSISGSVNSRTLSILLCLTFIVGNLHFVRLAINYRHLIKSVSLAGWQAIKVVPLSERVTRYGLTVYTPKTGDQCWDASIPCTPYFNDALRLRKPGVLASGFLVQK